MREDLELAADVECCIVILCLKMCPFFWSLHHYAVAGLYYCYTAHELFLSHDQNHAFYYGEAPKPQHFVCQVLALNSHP